MRAESRYAKSGDVHIAYQITGNGPGTLVFVPGFVSHVEYMWEEPHLAHFFDRLGSFCRLRKGTGHLFGANWLICLMCDFKSWQWVGSARWR